MLLLDYQTAKSRIASEYQRYAIASFVHLNNFGVGLSFKQRDWLVAIYQDHSDHIVIKKSSQCGITEFAIVDMLWLAKQKIAGLYVLPTDTWKATFVPNRIDKAVSLVKEYKETEWNFQKQSDSKSMKTFFGTNWKFVGSKQRNNFYEFPAGCITIDEYDLCDRDNLIFAEDRLGASEHPMTRKFGNPSFAGMGIDEEYNKSDAKSWFIKCPHCNHQQVLDWFDNGVRQDDNGHWLLRDKNASLLCSKCNRSIDRLSSGEWVAEHLDRKISGYSISRLFADIRDMPIINNIYAEWLNAQNNPTALQRFYNNILGMTYEDDGAKFTYDLLRSCADTDYKMPDGLKEGQSFAGMDVGSKYHLHISQLHNGMRRKVFVGAVRDLDTVQVLCHKYKVCRGVADALPEQHLIKEWCNTHPGWYRCFYNKDIKEPVSYDHKKKIVSVNRTSSLDESLSEYWQGGLILPMDWATLDNGDFIKQMCAATRVFNEDKNRYEWQENGKADHHQHADNYERIAVGMTRGQLLTVG